MYNSFRNILSLIKPVVSFCLFLLFLLTPLSLFSQLDPIRFQHITTRDGLPQNVVFSAMQDSKGYMWFGLYNGIALYDGYTFKHFQNDPKDKNTIPTGAVFALHEDHKGFIWVGTSISNLSYYDPVSEKFTTIHAESEKFIIPGAIVNTITEDRHGNMWFGTQNEGIVCWDRKTKKLKYYKKNKDEINPVIQGNYATCSLIDHNGMLWFGLLNGGLIKYDETLDKFVAIKTTDNINEANPYGIISMMEDKEGIFWLGTNKGLVKYNPRNGKYVQFLKINNKNVPDDNTYIYAICEDKSGFLWLGTYNKGLIKWDKKKGLVVKYMYDEENPYGIKSNKISCLYFDKSGNLWAGSEEGLHKADLKKPKFYLYPPSLYNFQSFHKKGIRDVFQDKEGNIWLGTEGNGLVTITEGEEPEAKRYLFNQYAADAYGYNYVNAFLERENNEIWLATVFGLSVFDKKTGKFLDKKNPKVKSLANDSSMYSIVEDKEGMIWLGTRNKGLIRFNPQTNTFQRFLFSSSDTNTISSNFIWSFFEDKDGILWLGTSEGINKVIKNPLTGEYTFRRYPFKFGSLGLPGSNVWDINEDNNGNLWLATVDGSLKRFNKNTQKFRVFTTADGLPSNVICSVLKDDHGMFWISTLNGICHFDPLKNKVIHIYNENDGLQDNRFHLRARYKNPKTGEMFFAGPNGFNRFHPDSIIQNSFEPPIVINSFKVEYLENKKDLLDDSAITLNYFQNSFSIEFASLDFTNPDENTFTYKLQGLDKNWVSAGNRHFVSYTNLAPGNYVFYLKGTNSDGLWSDEVLKLSITIIPPLWQTWWFIGLLILLGLIVLFIVVYGIISGKEAKRKMIQAELNSLRTQLNSHFVFNSLSSLQHFIMGNEKKLALTYLSKFATLMRMILANAGKALISLAEEKKFLELYLFMESVRFDNKFAFIMEIDPAIDPETVNIPPMLLQPLVENSLKHGLIYQREEGGKIIIQCIRQNKEMKCIVEDNGIGRKKAMEFKKASSLNHESMGIKILYDRLKIYNEGRLKKASVDVIDLYDINSEPVGTRVEIIFPYLD